MTKVAVFDSNLSIIKKDTLTTGSESFFKVNFVFNPETWDNYKERYAVFYQVISQPKLEIQIPEDNTVEIPNELLCVDLPLFIGVYGVKSDYTILSTNFKEVPVFYGAFTGEIQSFSNQLSGIVRSLDTKIKYIRLNEEGEFQYTTDGENWRLVTDTIDYQEIFNQINLVKQEVDTIKTKLPNDNLVYFFEPTEDNDEDFKKLETEYSYEKKCVFAFLRRNFIKCAKYDGWYRLSLAQATHGLINPYLSGFVITKMINDVESINFEGQSSASCFANINSKGDVHIYVNLDLSKYTDYSGKIILKGE